MTLYRYEFEFCGKTFGLLTGLDTFFNVDEVLSLGWFFEEKLKEPTINMENTISFFTKKGNAKFRKAIKRIKDASIAKNIGLCVKCFKLEVENLSDSLYTDNMQVVYKKINACVA